MTPQKERALPGEAGWALNTGLKAAGEKSFDSATMFPALAGMNRYGTRF